MESLHLSFSRAVEAGIFKGYKIDPSTTLSFFYADDAVFIGEWSHSNLKGVMNILRCFSLLSGMLINIQKSHLLGVGIPDNCVAEAAKSTGCDRKIAWTNGSKVLALRNSEVGSFSFFASQTGLFFSVGYGATFSDNSLWSRIISALHGLNGHVLSAAFNSTWSSIITEVNSLKVKGVDLISHCKIRVGKGTVHPPAPLLIPHECISHCQIGGYDVFPGTGVFINAWAIARERDTWGLNPTEFYPERFETFEVDYVAKHFEMVPFGGGRRTCPGYNSALGTIELTLANLLYWFDWEVPDGVKNENLNMEENGSLVVRKKTPLCLVSVKKNWQDLE
ncbi:cytochrome P450 71B34-like protein [Tanacetum coccineum]